MSSVVHCTWCAKPLKREESRRRRAGPVCYERYGEQLRLVEPDDKGEANQDDPCRASDRNPHPKLVER